ncbi:MAG: hypothetical protein RL071_4550 [Pseudomonadota bacterium]|jgi:hypothetical protein
MPTPTPAAHWTSDGAFEALHRLEYDHRGHEGGVRLHGHVVEAGHLLVVARGGVRYIGRVERDPHEHRCAGLCLLVLSPAWPGTSPEGPVRLALADLELVDLRWPTHAELGLR